MIDTLQQQLTTTERDKMQQVFMPYVYAPSAEASYVKVVTPLGELHVKKDVVWKAVVSVSLLLVTLLLYKLCFTGPKKKSKKKEPKLQKSGDVRGKQEEESSSSEEDESDSEDDGRSALDESILKKGEHSYYYAHQRRVVKDDAKDEIKKTMVSTYGWVDNKSTVRYVN